LTQSRLSITTVLLQIDSTIEQTPYTGWPKTWSHFFTAHIFNVLKSIFAWHLLSKN